MSSPASKSALSPPAALPTGKQEVDEGIRRRSALPWLVGVVLLLALFPRLQHLGDVSFRFDEGFSRKMITFDFVEIWNRTSRDVHPPLYYWFLKGWAGVLGDSLISLRSMSVLFGVLTVFGAFLLVREAERGMAAGSQSSRFGVGVALLAAAIVALSPIHIAWSLQARMYSLGTTLAAFSSWLLLRALRPGPTRFADWFGYVVLAVALAHTHIFGLFTIVAQALFAVGVGIRRGWPSHGRERWNTLLTVLLAFFAVEFLWLPWLGEFLEQKQRVAAGYWIGRFRWEQIGNMGYRFFAVPRSGPSPSPEIDWIACGLCAVVIVGLLLFGRAGHRLIALGFGLPIAAAMAVSYFVQDIFIPRYFLFAHLSLLCAIAVTAGHVPTRPARFLACGGLLLVASLFCLTQMQLRDQQARRPGLTAAMDYLGALRESGEPVVIGNPMLHAAVLSHIGDRERVYVIGSGDRFPHFQGTPVMRDDEYLDAERIPGLQAGSIWAVEGVHWNGGTWSVKMPEPWIATQEARFPELYHSKCVVVVRRYERLDSFASSLRQREDSKTSGEPSTGPVTSPP